MLDGPLGVIHISFIPQPLDLLSWFYVHLLDFGLLCNLIHHLALYQVSVRRLKDFATPLPPLLVLLPTACGSLRLAMTPATRLSLVRYVPCPTHIQKSDELRLAQNHHFPIILFGGFSTPPL